MPTTQVSDLINPQVMADMISARISNKIVVSPFARIDTSLVGVPGNKITVPQYSYIGDAADVLEGIECGTTKLATTTTEVTVKKAMKAVELTDEAVLSGYGNPVGETNNQLALSIASKIDADAIDALQGAQIIYNSDSAAISYNGIVDAIDLFNEEVNTEKAMFINPKQVTKLRKDANFISADKYGTGTNVVMSGEIGKIANTRIVPSKRVTLNATEYYVLLTEAPSDWTTGYTGYYTESDSTYTAVAAGDAAPEFAADTYYYKVNANSVYSCPIIKIETDTEVEDESPALTIYLKRDTNVETERQSLKRLTDISVDKIYAVALSNSSKALLAKFKKK